MKQYLITYKTELPKIGHVEEANSESEAIENFLAKDVSLEIATGWKVKPQLEIVSVEEWNPIPH